MSILDELLILPPTMGTLGQYDDSLTSRLTRTSDTIELGGKKLFAPWMFCGTTRQQAGSHWLALCRLARAIGMVVECNIDQMEGLSEQSVPMRLERSRIDQALNPNVVKTADLLEITCQSARSGNWSWPPEAQSLHELNQWLSTLRRIARPSSAIGLGLPVGIDAESIATACRTGIDFLTLHADAWVADELIVKSLCQIRSISSSDSTNKPHIILRCHHHRAEHLLKWIALGASLVSIDGWMSELWTNHPKPEIKAFTIEPTPQHDSQPARIQQRFDLLQKRLNSVMDRRQTHALLALQGSVRALSAAAASLAQVPLLTK